MPAIRTTPAGRAPPQKTERTHLENQERAYVAASRRSDRSLEARIESAKRASAIHKQRTGREFKITEQIVQDEEMYEEQDDNMPYQYRGLAAHLQSTDPQFNARLSAFLQTQIGMRDMVANGMNGMNGMNGTNSMNFSYGHPGDTQFAQFPQAMGANQAQHNQPLQQAQNPSMPIRQAPYPPRLQQQLGFSGFSPQGNQPSHYSGHHRSMSYSVPKREPQPNAMHPSMDNHRRMSTPGAPSSQSPAMSPHSVHSAHSTPGSRPAFLSRHSSGHMTHMAISQSQSQQQTSIAYSHQDYFPLTPQLSREAQGLMGSTLDQSNPMNSMLMAGSGNLTSTWYDFGLSQPTPAENVPRHQVHPTREGLFTTVAPAALESQETKFFDEAFPANTTSDTATPVDADNSIWDDFTNVDFTGGDFATTEGFNNEDWTCLKSPVS